MQIADHGTASHVEKLVRNHRYVRTGMKNEEHHTFSRRATHRESRAVSGSSGQQPEPVDPGLP